MSSSFLLISAFHFIAWFDMYRELWVWFDIHLATFQQIESCSWPFSIWQVLENSSLVFGLSFALISSAFSQIELCSEPSSFHLHFWGFCMFLEEQYLRDILNPVFLLYGANRCGEKFELRTVGLDLDLCFLDFILSTSPFAC